VIIAVILTFIAAFVIISSIFYSVTAIKESPSYVLKRRLRRLAGNIANNNIPDELRSEILKETPPLERVLNRIAFFRNVDRRLDQAGLKISVQLFLTFAIFLPVLAATCTYIFYRNAIVAFGVCLAIVLIIVALLQYLKKKRIEKLTEQLPDTLMMVARSLRAGHSINSAIELVGLEMANPTGELFKNAYDQQKLGMRMTDALASMTDRIESLDLRFFITTVIINAEIGGNFAETLDKLAETILERIKIRRQVKVYTAQGRLSGYILAVLPIFMFLVFSVINPQYERLLLQEKLGHYMLIAAACTQLLGYLVIKKIINIRI
jgi:tight adherence protein B